MAKNDKPIDQAMLERMRVGWAYLEEERRQNLAKLVTKDAMAAFDTAFAYSKTLPPRMDSGFVQFYEALARVKKR